MTTLTSSTVLPEEGVGIVQVEFKDEDGVAVTPNVGTITWTLTDNPPQGGTATVINSREQVAITSAGTINIVLEGDDLQILTTEVENRFAQRAILVEYQYDSSVQSNLDDKQQHFFKVENLRYVT